MKKILALILSIALLLSFVACGENKQKDLNNGDDQNKTSDVTPDKPKFVNVGENGSRTEDAVGFQLEMPEVGEEIVILKTNKGDIYLRLFYESAPITVTNFVSLCKSGYYNGITFHRVIKDFMIQGGDPSANSTGGESVWGVPFEDEFNANLLNIRGAVAMANPGADSNSSQFFINQKSTADSKEYLDYDLLYDAYSGVYFAYVEAAYNNRLTQEGKAFKEKYPSAEDYIEYFITSNTIDTRKVPEEVWELYKANGGNITLDGAWRSAGGHTVFAQVFKGMDVVDAIAETEVDSNQKPVDAVVINEALVTKFTADMTK